MEKKKEKVFLLVVILSIILIVVSGFFSSKNNPFRNEGLNASYATIVQIDFDNTDDLDTTENAYRYQEFQIEITEGKHKGEKYWMLNSIETFDIYNIIVEEGEKILVSIDEDEEGNVDNLHLYDKRRDTLLLVLVILFILSVIIIGGKQGVKAIITLIFTVSIIINVLLPLILKGFNPIVVAILVLFVIICVTLIVIGGFSYKTLCAILGTTGGVVIAGLISFIFGKLVELSGLAGDSTQQLVYLLDYPDLDFQGVLFASIIIGSMGAIMDVSISIASSTYEIVSLQPNIPRAKLIKSGMNIGRDIIGSMSNTLILAYTGSSCELMLLFMASGTTFKEIVNLDLIATEIVRAIGGSIGLTFTIPLTVVLSSFVYKAFIKKTISKNTKNKKAIEKK